MDVHCSTCEEPWDAYHLRHDAIYETDLDDEEIASWQALPAAQKLSGNLREKFAAAGWQFGSSVLNVRHCPCCPKDAAVNIEKDTAKFALETMLGEDEDGLVAAFEDFRL